MRKISIVLFLLFPAVLAAQAGQWEPQGVAAGFVWDIIQDTNLTPNKYFIATDSGLYTSENLVDWTPIRLGFQDLSIKQLAWTPVDGSTSAYAALAFDGVYAQASGWSDWAFADETGLDDGATPPFQYGYRDARAMAFFHDGTNLHVCIALYGTGIFCRRFNPTENTGNPWVGPWVKDTSYTGNPYITSMANANGAARLLAASETVESQNGRVYQKYQTTWNPVGPAGINYLSIAADPKGTSSAKVLAGTDSLGVYASENFGANFNMLCLQASTLGPFTDVAVRFEGGTTTGVGTTGSAVYELNCPSPGLYSPYTYFAGFAKAVFPVAGSTSALVGTGGMGLWEYPSRSQPGHPIGTAGANALQTNNVTDIAIAFSASRSDAPPVIFTASETDGLYKCFRPTYCTRYFFASVTDHPGGVSGRSVALVPGYDEFGEVMYAGDETIIGKKTLYLGTADFGIFRSDNGGASWKKLIAFPSDMTLGGDFEIVKVVLAPDFNPATQAADDKHMFALTRKGGVFRSSDGGATWINEANLMSGAGNTTGYLVCQDLAISAGYDRTQPDSQVLFAATSMGLFKRTRMGAQFVWLPQGDLFEPLLSVALSPCFGLATAQCPGCGGPDPECAKETSTVVVGTQNNGIYYSTNGGTSFTTVSHPSCPFSSSTTPINSITALSMHPKTDVINPNNRLLTYVVKHAFNQYEGGYADLSLTSMSDIPDPCPSGTPLTYTTALTNLGPDNASSVVLEESLTGAGITLIYDPGGSDPRCSYNPGPQKVTCAIGAVNVSSTQNITVRFMVAGSGTLANNASVSASQNDPHPLDNSLAAHTCVGGATCADLAVTSFQDIPDPCPVESTLSYTTGLENYGPQNATGVVLEETLSGPGVTLTYDSGSSDPRCSYNGGTQKVTCAIGAMGPGSSQDVTVRFLVVSGSGLLSNAASVGGAESDPNPSDNARTIQTSVGTAPGVFSPSPSNNGAAAPPARQNLTPNGNRLPDAPELLFMKWIGGATPHFECFDADPSMPPLPDFEDYRIRKITFSPTFGAGGNTDVYAGHDYSGMWHAFHPPAANPAWDQLDGFYNTPDFITGLAECPDPISGTNPHSIVLAGTLDYGVMISFDSGRTYFPWGYGFEHQLAGHWYTNHDAQAVSCSERFADCDPACGDRHRILASASDCATFDAGGRCTARSYHGIYWGNFFSPVNQGRWMPSTLEGLPLDGHFVPEMRYCMPDSPFPGGVFAADVQEGALFSGVTVPDNRGVVWHLDNAGDPPTSLSDITCPGGQTGPSEPASLRSGPPRPRGTRGSFIWGAQSGLSGGFRFLGTSKYKKDGVWYSCTGLAGGANWRSILMLDSETVLIGSQGEDTNLSEGIYRNDQADETCTAWEGANLGFTSGDSSEITQNYSKKITGFAKVANGVLAAMQQGGLGNRAGGVFFSDTGSDGWAWVPVNSGMSCSSNYEVYQGTNIYTGSTCSGVYSTDVITYTGYPTAYFHADKSSDPWRENRVAFTNRSAGLVTGCSWTFGDSATGSVCNPTHDYDVQGYLNASVTLTGTNDASKSDAHTASVEIVDTRIHTIEKVTGDTIKVTWSKPAGSHTYIYKLYKDSTPAGSGATQVTACSSTCDSSNCWCSFSETSSGAYFKVQTTW